MTIVREDARRLSAPLLLTIGLGDLVPQSLSESRRQRRAFTRLYALGRDDEAEAMLPTLKNQHPDHAARIDAITSQLWPRDVRLAMVLLTLPNMTGWIRQPADLHQWTSDVALNLRHRSARGMDLPSEIRTGGYLQRDLETYLMLPTQWSAFRGMRGSSIGFLDRAHDRRIRPSQGAVTPRILPQQPDDEVLPFDGLIAWSEITALSPQSGAARRAAETLVLWADARTDTWIERTFAPQDDMAEALRQVVLMARHNDIGTSDDGKPLARRAFEIMHYRLFDSPATAQTSYWHPCNRGCEN
jgi:hypothetical protein